MNLLNSRWHLLFFAGLVVYVGIRHVFVQRTRVEKKAVSLIDTREKILLTGMSVSVLLLPMLFLLTPWLRFADYHLSPFMPWIGAAAMAASLWLFWRSHADLGQNWSVSLELREHHELITRGVYRFVSHPMYASIWLWALAQALMLSNWLAGWATMPAFAAMYILRTPREERLMAEKFGQPYHDYLRATGRIFPRLRTKRHRKG